LKTNASALGGEGLFDQALRGTDDSRTASELLLPRAANAMGP